MPALQHRVLSLNPPYGTLIAACERYPDLGKHNETRGRWGYAYRGPLLIHQTLGHGDMFEDEDDLRECCEEAPFRTTLQAMNYRGGAFLPRGKIVAACELYDVARVETVIPLEYGQESHLALVSVATSRIYPMPSAPEADFGNYDPGRFVLMLRNIRALTIPIPARGQQGLWTWTGDIGR